jgi:hypothetical protein
LIYRVIIEEAADERIILREMGVELQTYWCRRSESLRFTQGRLPDTGFDPYEILRVDFTLIVNVLKTFNDLKSLNTKFLS